MRYYCCDEGRRKLLRRQTGENKLNGIEYLEVLDSAELPDEQRQRKLYVHFTSRFDEAPGPKSLTKSNVKIEGGERVRDIVATAVEFDSDVVTVTVNKPGDFSRYTLRLVTDSSNSAPPAGIDPILSLVEFSFKVNCPSDFDCKSAMVCPSLAATQPQIDYLTKDYASFRRLMLDRLALLLPG
ncbi:MAG: putative baseplate assembly protein, partial [candidate division WOR-3 bacterium]